jgi:hypothetical protein
MAECCVQAIFTEKVINFLHTFEKKKPADVGSGLFN